MLACLLGLVGLSATAYARRRRILALLLGLPPSKYRVARQHDVRVPMPDGVHLVLDRYVPQHAGRFPAILIRTPYGRGVALNRLIATLFAERGYQVVVQDVRGRSPSEGVWEPFVHEGADGVATLDWIARQPWSNGQAAMWGPSYIGFAQWAAAGTGSPHLKALLPIITQSNFAPVGEHGYRLDRTLRWLLILHLLEDTELSRWDKLRRSLSTAEQDRILAPGFTHLPLATVDEAVFGKPVPFYRTWTAHPSPDDPYWRMANYHAAVPGIGLPIHLVGGWYDIFIAGMLRDYQAAREAGRQPYLTVGPWTHFDLRSQLEGVRQGLSWFDAHLKGDRSTLRHKAVRIFVLGARIWRELDAWPPAVHETRFFLHPEGRLAPAAPPAGALPDCYRYDPADPTPHIGGALLSVHAGPRDNRPLEERDDVLCYTTRTLGQPVELIGVVRIELWVRLSLDHTDLFGRLCVVHPDGRSINICDVFFRLYLGRGEL